MVNTGNSRAGWALLDFLICTSKAPGRKASALKSRLSEIRFAHLINGNVDFSLHPHRDKSTIKGLRKREGVARKHPPNTDFPRWANKELARKYAARNSGGGSLYLELYTACIRGVFYLLRISDLEALTWEDIAADTQDGQLFLSIRINRSKTDVCRGGVLRSLIEIDSAICPLGAVLLWDGMSYQSGNEECPVFGLKLRGRVGSVMKMSALTNGSFGGRIDTHSLRSGGATALYTQGVPLGVTQRWGRRMSLTIRHRLWHDATALNKLSQVFAKSHALIHCLKLMNKHSRRASFQQTPPTVAGVECAMATDDHPSDAALFLPNENCRAGSSTAHIAGAVFSEMYASDMPPYTSSP